MRNSLSIVEDSRLEIIELQHYDITGAVDIKPHHREIDLNDLINYQIMRRRGITNITNAYLFKKLESIKTHFKDSP
jgi:predicted nucleic acid-binding protein